MHVERNKTRVADKTGISVTKAQCVTLYLVRYCLFI